MRDGKIFCLIYDIKDSYENLNIFKDPYTLYQVGNNNLDLNIQYKDSIGENISEENNLYSEYTAMYQVWKNKQNFDYVGFNHPNRYLLDNNNNFLSNDFIINKLNNYDFIIPPKIIFEGEATADRIFEIDKKHDSIDLFILKESIKEYLNINFNEDVFIQRCYGNQGHYNNIFITSKEEFNKYMNFCFNIFNILKIKYQKYKKELSHRLFGYLGEFLLDIYINTFNKTYFETNLNFLNEKIYSSENPIKMFMHYKFIETT